MSKNRTKFVTSPVAIKYSHITKPDTAFNGSDYKVTVVASDELITQLTQLASKWGHQPRFIKEKDGEKLVTFKSKFMPDRFTKDGVEAREDSFAWGGDTIAVEVDAVEYDYMGQAGISLRMSSVCLIERDNSSGKGASKDPFAAFGASKISEDSQLSGSDAVEAPAVPEFNGDDMPF
jgi:hypothetical protein